MVARKKNCARADTRREGASAGEQEQQQLAIDNNLVPSSHLLYGIQARISHLRFEKEGV